MKLTLWEKLVLALFLAGIIGLVIETYALAAEGGLIP